MIAIRQITSTILFSFLLFSSTATFAAPSASKVILLNNINVIDATGSPVQMGMNVLIEDGFISAIQKDKISIGLGEKIDGTGRFLIPGLWDMHVHWYAESYLPLFIANGVTGTRQMWGFPMHYDWKSRIASSEEFISPRILIASIIIDGPNKIRPGSLSATTELEGREYVRRFHGMGADFIKVYHNLRPNVYFAIADESQKLGIPFAGHVPTAITVEEVSDAGQESIEHLEGIPLALSSDRHDIQEASKNASSRKERLALSGRIVDTFDPSLMAPLFDRLKKNGTWQSPTLTVLRNSAYLRERAELDRERLEYLPAYITSSWEAKNNPFYQNWTAEDWVIAQRNFEHSKMLVGELNRAGVKIIAGTDVSNPYCFPGFSLHDELQLLVESGLTPMQALQAATKNAAEFSKQLDVLGTVEVGKIADLVILDANPLIDIRNTTKISTVIFDGRVYSREKLDKMLEAVKSTSLPSLVDLVNGLQVMAAIFASDYPTLVVLAMLAPWVILIGAGYVLWFWLKRRRLRRLRLRESIS